MGHMTSSGVQVLQYDANGSRQAINSNGVVIGSMVDAASNRLMGFTGGQSAQFTTCRATRS